MSHALSHIPRVHHPRELSREEQTSTIKGESPEGSTPNEQRSCSPSTGRGRLPPASDCPRNCSPSVNRGCSHQASTCPGGAARHRRLIIHNRSQGVLLTQENQGIQNQDREEEKKRLKRTAQRLVVIVSAWIYLQS